MSLLIGGCHSNSSLPQPQSIVCLLAASGHHWLVLRAQRPTQNLDYWKSKLLYDWWLSLSLMLRPTVSRPVPLVIKHPSGADDQTFITVRQLRVCWRGALSLTRREDGSVVYNCCWSSPAQSFLGPRPVGLATICYSPRFETSFFVASYDS
jgi:hypothetical protein